MSSVKLICKNCILIKRNKILRVVCDVKKHKQRQG